MARDSLEPAAGGALVTPGSDPDGDLAAKVTHKIVGVVDKLNRVSARPATLLARGIVFGLLGLTLVFASLVLLTIGGLRVLDIYLPEDVWAAHLALGSIFTVGGLFVWSKRKPSEKAAKKSK